MANSNLKVSPVPVREQATQPGAGRKVLARIGHMPHGRAEVPDGTDVPRPTHA